MAKGGRLTEDEIKYIVSVESDKAQQEIHELTKETKDLAKEERTRKQAMVELEAQGKKNTKEYANLRKETKSYSDRIKENNKKVAELTSKLDVNALSMVQLRKRAKELQSQLDNTAEALNPESYAKTAAELDRVKNRMGELRNGGQKARSEFDLTQSAMSKLKVAAMALITVKLGEWLAAAVSKAYSVRKEFSKYEAVLRNTLGSQDAAAESMKRLQKLAADTPYSLQEWTEGYIKLINRGIKPTNTELMQMGDIAASQGKTLDQFIEALLDAMTGENERLKEFGIRANAAGDKVKFTFKGVTTEVEKSDSAIVNYVLSLGKLQGVAGGMAVQMNELAGQESNLGDTMDAFWNRLGKRLEPYFKKALSSAASFFKDLTGYIKPVNEQFDDQFTKVVELEKEIPSLLSRYEELKNKANLSASEHKELASLIERITKLVPGAVSGWDDYGRAISLNTNKVREFMTAERARLKFLNREQIDSLRQQRTELQRELQTQQNIYKRGSVWSGSTAGRGATDTDGMRKLSDKEKAQYEASIKELGETLLGLDQQLSKLSGSDLDKVLYEQVATEKYAATARANFVKQNQDQLAKWIADEKNAGNRYMDIAKEVYESRKKTPVVTSDKSDPNTVALKNLETANEDKINAIRLAGREQQQSEYETEQAVLKQEEDYYLKRISMLQKFAETAKKKDKRAAYESQIVTAKTKLLDIEVSKEQQAVKALESLRDAELAKEQQVTKAQQTLLSDRLSSGEITQEQYNAMLLTIDTTSADTRLAIAERFANDVSDLELKNAKLKEQTVTEANKAVVDSEKASADARVKQMKYLNEMVKDFKEQFKLTTVGEDLDVQIKALDAAYQARKEMALKNNLDTEALDKAYLQAKERLTQESEQRIMAVREQYGLATEQEKYNAQLEQLKLALDQQLLTQEEYEQAVQNLKRDSYKKQFDYYLGLFSGAVQALQQAEMDNVDAKYDAEIAAAQGNAEEVERLENEKAQKKLDIEKKYADINFAVKASQIIADTAVSIMKALAELGPIAGPVAAALMGITGAAQLASANAERQKIKNMTISSSSSSSSGKRVATGRESGGYVDVTREQDGKPFRAKYDPDQRGYVDKPTVIVGEGPSGQSREWVASNAAVSNPSVAPIIDVIDKAQRAGNIRTLDLNAALKARGYVGGGYIASPTVTTTPVNNNNNSGAALPPELMRRLAEAVINIDENGVSAPVVLTELEKKQQLRDRSRKIGSKKG
jgi:hypothetical protein